MKTTSWKRSKVFAVISPILFGPLGLIGPVLQAQASTIAVSTNSDTVADDGLCSLREAITAANTDTASGSSVGECPAGSGSDTITVPGIEISLGSQLVISSAMVLIGTVVGGTVINAGRTGGVIAITSGQVTLRGITIRGGNAPLRGGGVYIASGSTVEIVDGRIVDNEAFSSGGGLEVQSGATVTLQRMLVDGNRSAQGGGVSNSGTLSVHESLIGGDLPTQGQSPAGTGNVSLRFGGIVNTAVGTLFLSNTTVSGNATDINSSAGNGGITNFGYAFLNSVTITKNTGLGSDRSGGLSSTPGATTVVKNSIIAENKNSTTGASNDCNGALTIDSVYNLIRDATGCQLPPDRTTFKLNQDAKLGPLASNGGPTRTHALSAGSPAIDNGSDMPVPFFAHPSIDQRGYTRSGHGCRDIGPFEFGATPNPISNPRPCPPAPPSNLTIQ